MLSAYCIGNAAGPFMWQAQYKPRYVIFQLSLGSPEVIMIDIVITSRGLSSVHATLFARYFSL